jgi:hypothetical protein
MIPIDKKCIDEKTKIYKKSTKVLILVLRTEIERTNVERTNVERMNVKFYNIEWTNIE